MHLWTLCIFSLCIIRFALSSPTIYVVPSLRSIGNEDGTLKNPFATIEQARDHLRTIFRDSIQRVALYPTYHYLNGRTLSLDERDHSTIYTAMSNNERNQITFERRRDLIELEFPIISGGIHLINWTIDEQIWRIRIPRFLPAVTQLFVNGQRAVRSRLPINDYYHYEKGLDNRTQLAYRGFVYREHQFDNITLSSTSCSEIIIYHSFTTSRHYFSKIFPQNRTILFTNPSLSIIGNITISQQSGQRFHLENIYEGMIVQEGSFFFDSMTQMLYYHARSTEHPRNTSIILPIHEIVLSMVNATKIEWNSVGIEHSAWMTSAKVNKSIPIDGRAAADYLNRSVVAIYLRNSTEITFNQVETAHIAGYAIQIDENCQGIRIENSQMYDLGAGGIRIGLTEHNRKQFIENILIKNCTFYNNGHLFPMGVGILIQLATRNVLITQNTLYAFYHTAIHIGWSWNYDESSCYNQTISFNYIHHLGQHTLSELGGIYTCGVLNDTIITNNVLHDIYGYFLHDWGVYLADGSSQLMVTNTIIYNTGSAGITMIYGFNNTFRNNVLARSSNEGDGELSLYRREAKDHLVFTFYNNIVYDTVNETGRWIFQVQAPDPFSAPYVIMDRNCYYNSFGAMFIFGLGRLVFSEWQETNHDMNSFIGDPLFLHAKSQCNFFQLNPNSQAVLYLGFKPIEQLPQWKPGC
ncbi:unnamed protein product [Adineta ricciae]|uniref:Right handed beta helix domain-containing protein n=1 Tax=Adineta ricciae TaxID=249248 RepID=A0A815VIR8_ADIRI|nr:unnamed protein product [Adineta ricciae]CAF1530999.1 unnamed protein product [Adineta ricciae]